MRSCYDSTNASDVPTDCDIVAGYINGTYRWTDADWARFPGKPQVRISVNAQTNDGNCLDVETGDAYPHEAPGWVQMRRAVGIEPTCYVNRANWQLTRDAFAQAQVPEPHWWLASYDGDPTIPDGCVAKQYANEPITGGHYDASSAREIWPGVDMVDQFVTKQEFEAYQQDVKNTLDAIKAQYDPIAAKFPTHTHEVKPVTNETGEPQ